MRSTRTPLVASGAAMVLAGLGLTALPSAAQEPPNYTIGECPAPAEVPVYEQNYIDTTRAGGEPIVETHPDGTLLWGSHAGTTHIYLNPTFLADPQSAVFLENYEGQTYYYFSPDNGETWEFVPRTPIRDTAANGASGVPVSGFSDPEFAIDLAGNVFVSEINLANIAVSKSTDSGRSYVLQSLVEITASDRQWMEADEEDVLYFVANTFGGGSTSSGNPVTGSLSNSFYKSTDGGATFSVPQEFVGGQASSDIRVDRSDGTVYQLGTNESTLVLFRLPNARNETPPNMTVDRLEVTPGGYSKNSSIDPNIEVDADGNLYVSWAGTFDGEQGIWYQYSTDKGDSWSFPMNIVPPDVDDRTNIWSWMDVGDTGGVSITWLKADAALVDNEQENATGPWQVWTALTQNGLGCGGGPDQQPGFVVSQASIDAPHTGQICSTGTTCEARAVDRRLGDYFANTIDQDGRTLISVTDTRQGGAVGLPLQIRQVSGPLLRGFDASAPAPAPTEEPAPAPEPTEEPAPEVEPIDEDLPATGGGLLLTGLGLMTMAMGARRRR